MDFSERYDRNQSSISAEEQEKLKNARVLVIGCGGLVGYVIEFLARIGVGSITAVDGDVFCVSNLNRQLISNESNIGMSKADEAMKRVKNINSGVKVTAHNVMLWEAPFRRTVC